MTYSTALAPSALVRTWEPEYDAAEIRGKTKNADVRADARGAGTVVFENVGKTYSSSAGTVDALTNISLTIEAGSIFGIIGRSGAG
jgi:ABC-type glutathione transport system ATPase component